mmetsp:Transcript_20555/g.38168  ORF Transcript_20555/g.38168 Transcript_20555/m.38168 type:complete len:317 (+) Transcript_20555:37-987(+)
MVTVFDGQLLRTWKYEMDGFCHQIHLYHDTITGVRSATLNHEEISESLGTSNLFMEASGHRILFSIKDTPGYIEIKRSGWVSFDYTCNIGGENIVETTQQISAKQNEELYKLSISGYTACHDGQSEEAVVWYAVVTERLSDGCRNVVHRRFKDFSSLNSEIKQTFKGHQLLSSLPNFVEKKSKWMVDHSDSAFLEDRRHRLEIYLTSLVGVPHVADTASIKAFLGLMEKVRETSVVITGEDLGFTLTVSQAPGTPAVVGSIQDEAACDGLKVGDLLSKIGGQQTGAYKFSGIETCLKHHPRPVVLHFVQSLKETSS